GSNDTFSLIMVQRYERVLSFFFEDEPMFMLLKALVAKGFGLVQQALINVNGEELARARSKLRPL
ncbi:MAG: hypothetical protein RID53_26370, partial [Coleofasciculus sp. B1-GNL1-01]